MATAAAPNVGMRNHRGQGCKSQSGPGISAVLRMVSTHIRDPMTTFPNRYGCTADDLIGSLETSDAAAHTTRAPRGRHWLPVLQLLTGAAVLVTRRVERANR